MLQELLERLNELQNKYNNVDKIIDIEAFDFMFIVDCVVRSLMSLESQS